MRPCPLCKEKISTVIYEIRDLPIFQNKVYATELASENADTGDVLLVQCSHCGFVYNAEFNSGLMHYNDDYQNEQAHSPAFREYLTAIIDYLFAEGLTKGRIVEVGCGKGYFLELLIEKGFDAVGFDPAYEGENKAIIKDYFSQTHMRSKAEAIVLRHTLEHIENPLDFLHLIANSNNDSGKIFIEVPSLEWIVETGAIWDVFYEHCNYFSAATLSSLFNKPKVKKVFGGQYLTLISDLKNLKSKSDCTVSQLLAPTGLFKEKLNRCKEFVKGHKGAFLWGAGAKGSTFVNLMDPHKTHIAGIIDINPKKQNCYVGKTGHKIFSEDILRQAKVETILIMNENYKKEIAGILRKDAIRLHTIEEI